MTYFVLRIASVKYFHTKWFLKICRRVFISRPKIWTLFFIFFFFCTKMELFPYCRFTIWWTICKILQIVSCATIKQRSVYNIKIKCSKNGQRVFHISERVHNASDILLNILWIMFTTPQIIQSTINFKIPKHFYRDSLKWLSFTLLNEKKRNYRQFIKTYSSNTPCNTYQPIVTLDVPCSNSS